MLVRSETGEFVFFNPYHVLMMGADETEGYTKFWFTTGNIAIVKGDVLEFYQKWAEAMRDIKEVRVDYPS